MKMNGCLFFLMFLLCTVSVLAETKLVNAPMIESTGVVVKPYVVGPKVHFSPSVLTNASGVHIITAKALTSATQEKINSLEIQPDEIFSPVLSEVTNLKVDPTIESGKVVYRLELAVNTPIHKDQEVISPIFDLRVKEPVEFKLHDQKIVINDEQIIDYKEVMEQIVRENEVFPPIALELQSEINSEIYDLTVIPGINSTTAKFIYRKKEVIMPIHNDFKIKDKKLYLIKDNKVHDLKVLPPEVYSAVYSGIEKTPEVLVKELTLKIEDEKPIYDLRVDQPAKLLWIIPWTVESKYVIDPADGSAKLVNNPWYITSVKIGEDDDDIVFLWPEYNPL
ncbi:hypothetical protein K8R43_05605 [archaeon]|nr:hypothetical protein [archaeon]